MRSVDWLPPHPLRVSTALGYTEHDHIECCEPILGLNPTPFETVVFLYVGIRDRTLYPVFDPLEEAWVPVESGRAIDVIPQTERISTEAMAFLESYYPESTFTHLTRENLTA